MSAVEPLEPGQAPEPALGQEPASTPPQEGTPAGPEPQGESAETKRLRQEAANYRTQLREREAELQAIKDAALSEEQRREQALTTATAERDELRAQLHSTTLRADVFEAARSQGIVDPDAAFRLMDTTGLVAGSDGYDELLAERLAKLVDRRPYLKAQSGEPPEPKDPPQIPPSSPARPRDPKQLTSADLNRMTRDEVAALPADVRRAAMTR